MLPSSPSSAPDSVEPTFTVLDLARLYELPEADGHGLIAGLVLLGGGLDAESPTWDTYFRALGLPRPEISVVEVAGATNAPTPYNLLKGALLATGSASSGAPLVSPPAPASSTSSTSRLSHSKGRILPPSHMGRPHKLLGQGHRLPPDLVQTVQDSVNSDSASASPPSAAAIAGIGWTFEGIMDLQLLGALLPCAEIRVYIAPEGDAGIAAAIRQAIADGVVVLSNSYSYSEKLDWTQTEAALAEASGAGMTVTAAAGNYGSTFDGSSLSVGYPASSAQALACGGTELFHDGAHEEVWKEQVVQQMAGGGGFSEVWDRPTWQAGIHDGTRRGIPDLASNAAHESGCWIWIQDPDSPPQAPTGLNGASFGTSASAPVIAATFARFSQLLGRRLGLVQPLLYRPDVRDRGFRHILAGDNAIHPEVREYEACAGWSPCTGLGRPVGGPLLDALRAALKGAG